MQIRREIVGVQEGGVFYDRAAALKWLGLETLPDPVKPEEGKKVEAAEAGKNHKTA